MINETSGFCQPTLSLFKNYAENFRIMIEEHYPYGARHVRMSLKQNGKYITYYYASRLHSIPTQRY